MGGVGGWLGSRSGGADVVGRADDDAVEGVGSTLHLVDRLGLVGFESYLATVRPGTFHSRVLSKEAEDGVVAG